MGRSSARTIITSAPFGYTAAEVAGKHHSIFMKNEERQSAEYQQFWEHLWSGQFQAGQHRRIGRNGKDVWVNASYNPILGSEGTPVRVLEFATDVTERVTLQLALKRHEQALRKSQALLEQTGRVGGVGGVGSRFCGWAGDLAARDASHPGRAHRITSRHWKERIEPI